MLGTAVLLFAMVAVSWIAWDSVPEIVTTREAAQQRDATEVPRWVILSAFPAAGVVITGLLMLAPRTERVLERRFDLRFGADSNVGKQRALDLTLVLVSGLLLALQILVALLFASAPIPVLPAVLAVLGPFLVALGAAMPAIGRAVSLPRSPQARRLVWAWAQAHRPGGRAMSALGLALLVAVPAAHTLVPQSGPAAVLVGGAAALSVLLPFAVMALSTVRTLLGADGEYGEYGTGTDSEGF
ncbi:hypothetical protein LP52_05015 [Streptomonospora alba]|uniref:DUF1648 domain-containing protein n=1 Tax=Streptomonospora alba TaxID=183763 RepID=A0A0C2JL40_9ACTN|nr:hypothetical protein [Streptomonospora alba]KIH99635.1 hypothetical protein LP52_05015 [Streptomonospora alba]